mgnify:FL=1
MKYLISIIVFIFIILNTTAIVMAKQPRAKFYDFNEQLIDGEIKKPTTLYTGARDRVKFGRLLRLKKSFLPELFATSKESVFK